MLENLNTTGGKGIWILRPKWRNSKIEDVQDMIVNEMKEFKEQVYQYNIRKKTHLQTIERSHKIIQIAKEISAKEVVIEPNGQLKIIF